MAQLWSLGVMDTRGTIYVRPPTSGQSLHDFASQMFVWLGISSFKEDVSGSWKVDIHFVVGSAVGIRQRFYYWLCHVGYAGRC